MTTKIDAKAARREQSGLPDGTSYREAPTPEQVYFSPSNRKAMDLDIVLVTGMRGAGKTFWWNALQNENVRRLIGRIDG